MEEINKNNLKDINLKKLASNKDLGRLNFESILLILEELRGLFVDLVELDYQGKLTDPEISRIKERRQRFVDLLNQLRTFDIGQANSQQRHDQLEEEIKNLRSQTWEQLRHILSYLRQDAEFGKKDVQELQEERKQLIAERKKAEELNAQLAAELEKLKEQQSAKASVKGEIAAQTFGKHFEASAREYKDVAEKRWYVLGKWFFITLLALLLLLSYVVGFASRQYSINSHLSAANRHRKNIAETMKDFYESNLDDQAKATIIDRGTDAMFKNLPIGHISKSEHKDNNGPVHQVINQIHKIASKESQ